MKFEIGDRVGYFDGVYWHPATVTEILDTPDLKRVNIWYDDESIAYEDDWYDEDELDFLPESERKKTEMQGTKIRDSKSRLFESLYRGRRRMVTKTVWYLKNGTTKHDLRLTDVNERVVIKKWEWIEGAK